MKTSREEHNWPTHNISIDRRCYTQQLGSEAFFFFSNSYETVLINEILNHFRGVNVFLKNTETSDLMWFYQETVDYFNEESFLGLSKLASKFWSIFQIMFGLFLVSVITAIYIKVSILTAPAFLHLFCKSSCAFNILFLRFQ